jgi:hypothetical protein
MTTSYQCKTCKIVFQGHDPIYTSPASPQYPRCLNDEPPSPTALGGANPRQDHVVSLAVVAVPTVVAVPNPWNKTPKIVAETPEETERRKKDAEREKLQQRKLKAEETAHSDALKLLTQMQVAMNAGGGSVSSKFPLDLQYGTKESGKATKAPEDIIKRAGVLWVKINSATHSYRAASFKPVWNMNMANFERLRDATDPDGGKHNYHVIPE